MQRWRLGMWLVFAIGASSAAAPAQREAAIVAVLPTRTSPVTARLVPNRTPTPSVGIMEEEPVKLHMNVPASFGVEMQLGPRLVVAGARKEAPRFVARCALAAFDEARPGARMPTPAAFR
jgi:hypothetical protein